MKRSATAEGVMRSIANGDGRLLRSDGQRNRDQVVRAALEIFGENGMLGTVEQIATRAGVSRTTVYRSFPTRRALQIAVATSQFAQIHRIALLAQERSAGSGVGLVDFVFGAFEYNQANRLYLELFEGRPTAEMLDVHTASRRTIAELTDESRAAGVIRPEVTDEDVALFCSGMSWRLATDHATTQDDWRRSARFVLIGLGVPDELLPPRRVPQAHLDPSVADA
ncbi:TetR/AcrR family transcriptional regulator [Phytohabitans sp. ZYX-F-186]|uniref:TetR/AcrR family transcriptional regulator n=1 Tax=Phytohabitans maris TaxID=3071409 RepID=A0ABU0Z9S3_9ACTN|nr:TetR/AcrR family transcriptional regulator [Phytohabitans sp. ZYX-F-186]MDQ7903799.1 TetR/AcrR family transcriptional regulator [Phytohabitans sp. ZYX-F-186]